MSHRIGALWVANINAIHFRSGYRIELPSWHGRVFRARTPETEKRAGGVHSSGPSGGRSGVVRLSGRGPEFRFPIAIPQFPAKDFISSTGHRDLRDLYKIYALWFLVGGHVLLAERDDLIF